MRMRFRIQVLKIMQLRIRIHNTAFNAQHGMYARSTITVQRLIRIHSEQKSPSFIFPKKQKYNTPELTFGLLRACTHSYGQLQAHMSTSEKEKKKIVLRRYQCSGSGARSVCFWASWIRSRDFFLTVRIRISLWILLSSSKNMKKP
jgi:hypothetical protein